jgi:hypothetical protein
MASGEKVVVSEVTRGSDLLRARYTEDDLNELLLAAENSGAHLLNFFPYGVPAFDGASGTWTITPQQLAGLIEAIVAVRAMPQLRIITKGLPAVEAIEVSFEAGSRRSL